MYKQLDMGFEKEFDSKEELWFSYYLTELEDRGFISEAIYHPKKVVLSIKQTTQAFVKMKTFNKPKTVSLTAEHTYEPDWYIKWDKEAHGICYWLGGGVYEPCFSTYSKKNPADFVPFKADMDDYGVPFSIVDVKSAFNGAKGSDKFRINQMWMMHNGTYVQKIPISLCSKSLFAKTFFPRTIVHSEVYKKDYKRNGELLGKKGESKIKVDVRLIESWLKLKKH